MKHKGFFCLSLLLFVCLLVLVGLQVPYPAQALMAPGDLGMFGIGGMLIKYLGPSDSVNVEPYGLHQKNDVKEYPDPFGADLLATSKKQLFEQVEIIPAKKDDPRAVAGKMTVALLTETLEGLRVSIPDGSKKAELVELYVTATAAPAGDA